MEVRSGSPQLALVLLALTGGCGRVSFAPVDAGRDGASVDLDAAVLDLDVSVEIDALVDVDASVEIDAPLDLDVSLDLDAPIAADAGRDGGRPPGLGPNVAFVSTARVRGDFGGIAAADALCDAEAAAAGLPGNFVAWLGSPVASAASRLGSASGWVRPDGLVVATSRDALTGAQLLHTITQRADRTPSPSSASDPYIGGAADCAGWTTASPAVSGGVGRMGSTEPTGDGWGTGGGSSCDTMRPFYCFQIDHVAGVPMPTPVAGRRMFVSDPAAGRTPDATCQGSADAAGLGGTFRAFVPFTGISAVDRATLDGRPWVNLDGLVVFLDDAAVRSGAAAAPVRYDARRGRPVDLPVSGADTATRAGTAASTCADWTGGGSAESRQSIYYWGGASWFGWAAATCDDHPDPTFYCVEE